MAERKNKSLKVQSNRNTRTNIKNNYRNKKENNKYYLILAGVLIFTAILYSKSLSNNFTNWDDKEYFEQNNYIKNVSMQGVKDIFSTPYFANYHPLTTLTWLIEYKYWGLSPEAFHRTNLFLHLINILLVFVFIKLLTENRLISVFIAFLFAVHPLHVESVAWNSERKDLLYSLFFLLSLIAYLKYLKSDFKLKFIVLAFLAFVLSLLSKSMAVTLPVILIIIDYYYNRKVLSFKCIAEKIPFLILSVIFGIITIIAQRSTNSISNLSGSYSYFSRLFLITYGISFYLLEALFPYNLSNLHYYPDVKYNSLPIEYYFSILLIILVIWLIIKFGKQRKFIIFGLLFFLISISPVLQLIPVGMAIVSERYTYLPYLGLFLIIIMIADNFVSKNLKLKSAVYIVLGIWVIYLSVCTFSRVKIWENGNTMWEDFISKYPDYYYGHYGMGNAYRDIKKYPEAIVNYTKSIELKPNYAKGYNDRGVAKDYSNDFNGALADYNKAIELDNKLEEAYINRAILKSMMKDFKNSLTDFNYVLSLNPNNSLAYFNRGVLFLTTNEKNKSCEDFNKARSLGSSNAEDMIRKFCK